VRTALQWFTPSTCGLVKNEPPPTYRVNCYPIKTITIVNTLSLSIPFSTNKAEEYPQAVAWVRLCRVITQINPTQTDAFWCIPSLSHVVIWWLCVQVDLTDTHCESNLLPWHPIIYGCSIGSYNFVQTCWSPTSNFLGWKLSTRCMKHRS
jgi:hypothetical protein